MRADDRYTRVAEHYDLHGWDWYARTYGARLLPLLETHCPPPARVLDAGCGTGTLALAMARQGWQATGVDLSPGMIEVARRKPGAGAVSWHVGDIRALSLPDRFDAITCVADILNHLPEIEEWDRAFRSFAAHLHPGGVLFFDVMTSLGLERMDTYTLKDGPEGTLLLGVIFEPDTRRSTMKFTSFAPRGGDGLYDRVSQTIVEWAHPIAAILDRLAAAGFRDVERPWARAADPEDEERLAVLARRGGQPG